MLKLMSSKPKKKKSKLDNLFKTAENDYIDVFLAYLIFDSSVNIIVCYNIILLSRPDNQIIFYGSKYTFMSHIVVLMRPAVKKNLSNIIYIQQIFLF